MGITPAVLGGLASVGGSLFGMFGGGDKPQAPQSYQPANMPWADSSTMAGINNLGQYNTAGQTLGQYGQIAQGGVNNPYAGQYQAGANTASNIGWNTGLGQVGAGGATINSGLSMLPYAQSILQAGFDPMGNVYNQQFQQNSDQTRAGLESRGLNTNVAAINAGTGIQTAGLNTLNNASALPYSTANAITGNQLGLLNQYGQQGTAATNTANTSIQDLLAYLGYGNQAGGVANQGYANQITAQNNQFNQSQTLGKNLGAGLQGVFGNSSGGFNWGGNSGVGATGYAGSPYAGPVAP